MKPAETSYQQIRKTTQRILIGLIIFLLCGVCFLPAPATTSVQAQSNTTPTPIPNNLEIRFDRVPSIVYVMLSDGTGSHQTFTPDSNHLGLTLSVGTYDVLAIFEQCDMAGLAEVAIVEKSLITIYQTDQVDLFASAATHTTETFLRSLEGHPIPIPSMDILFSDLTIRHKNHFLHNLNLQGKPPDIVRYSDFDDRYLIHYKTIARDRYPGVLLDLSFLAQNIQANLTLWNDFSDLEMLDLYYDQPLPEGTVNAWYNLQSTWRRFRDVPHTIMLESDISSPWNFTIFQHPGLGLTSTHYLRNVFLAHSTSSNPVIRFPDGTDIGDLIHATPYFYLGANNHTIFLYSHLVDKFLIFTNVHPKDPSIPVNPVTTGHYNMTGSPIFFAGSLSNTPEIIRLNSDLGLYGFPGSLFRNSNYDLVWDDALLMVGRTDGQSETHTIGKYLPPEGYAISANDINGMLLTYSYPSELGESLGAVNFIIDPNRSDPDPAWIHQLTILNEDGQYSNRISPRDIIQLDLRDHNAIRVVTLAWRRKADISDEFNILTGEMIKNGVYNYNLTDLPVDTTIDLYLEIIDVAENYFILELRKAFYIHSAPGRGPVQPTAEAK